MAGAADLKDIIPNPPKFSDEDMQRCRDTGDYKPVLFEWYKFVGSLCVVVANIRPDCPVYRAIPPQHYYVLAGLLNRCARLMLSNVALSHEGKFGETTAIVDRCIFETAVKIIWLSHNASQEEFTRSSPVVSEPSLNSGTGLKRTLPRTAERPPAFRPECSNPSTGISPHRD